MGGLRKHTSIAGRSGALESAAAQADEAEHRAVFVRADSEQIVGSSFLFVATRASDREPHREMVLCF